MSNKTKIDSAIETVNTKPNTRAKVIKLAKRVGVAAAGLALTVGIGDQLLDRGIGSKPSTGVGSGVEQQSPIFSAASTEDLHEDPAQAKVDVSTTPEDPAILTTQPGDTIETMVERHLEEEGGEPVDPAVVDAAVDRIVEERDTDRINAGEDLIYHDR